MLLKIKGWTEFWAEFIHLNNIFIKSLTSLPGGATKMHLTKVGTTEKHGSRVSFKPDKLVFGTVIFNFDTIAHRLKELAFLNAGLKINLIDTRVGKEKEKH